MDHVGQLGNLNGTRVLLTGHTGFKGGWLTVWLNQLGAEVHGLSLDPPAGPSFFDDVGLSGLLAADHRVDLRDAQATRDVVAATKPDVVLHLAAQAIVKESYVDPLGTFGTNVMGTAHLLDALRGGPARAIVIATTDKVYENLGWVHPYREDDRLGGRDPYSASKAGTELVARAYRDSYPDELPLLATARAGNVIGGGDWAANRLVPDCMRAFANGEIVQLRNPDATRPWQHVLDPLGGYLTLASVLLDGDSSAAEGWNFGPDIAGDDSVGAVADRAARAWGDGAQTRATPEENAPHEAAVLRVSSSKARLALGWAPRWDLDRAVGETVAWHKARLDDADMLALTRAQIGAWTKNV